MTMIKLTTDEAALCRMALIDSKQTGIPEALHSDMDALIGKLTKALIETRKENQ